SFTSIWMLRCAARDRSSALSTNHQRISSRSLLADRRAFGELRSGKCREIGRSLARSSFLFHSGARTDATSRRSSGAVYGFARVRFAPAVRARAIQSSLLVPLVATI